MKRARHRRRRRRTAAIAVARHPAVPQLPLQRVARPVRRRDLHQRRQLLRRRPEGPLAGGAPQRRPPAHRRRRDVDTDRSTAGRRPTRSQALAALNTTCATSTSPTARRASTAGTGSWPRPGSTTGCALPHRRVQPRGRRLRRHPPHPRRRIVLTDGEWERATGAAGCRPTTDKTFVASLMQPVYEPGKMAGWVAPPRNGHQRQAVRLRVRPLP